MIENTFVSKDPKNKRETSDSYQSLTRQLHSKLAETDDSLWMKIFKPINTLVKKTILHERLVIYYIIRIENILQKANIQFLEPKLKLKAI